MALAASLFVAGRAAAAGSISIPVATLAEGVLKAMLDNKLKTLAAGSFLVAALGVGAVAQVQRIRESGRAPARQSGVLSQPPAVPTKPVVQQVDRSRADRAAPLTFFGIFTDWKYPEVSDLHRGADMSDGGDPSVPEVKYRAVHDDT